LTAKKSETKPNDFEEEKISFPLKSKSSMKDSKVAQSLANSINFDLELAEPLR